MGVSATLIVRDEERHLSGCLESLASRVDEIVVVDTGSRDGTREIALDFGVELVDEPWRDDFAHARNLALDKAREAWILYIDADERLTADEPLAPLLERAGATVAATVGFRARSDLTPYREHRLFRNRPDIRFRGVIHETVLPDIRTAEAAEGAEIPHLPVHIEHLGYEGDVTHKHERNLPLLQRALEDSPERIYLYLALGEAQLGLGDPVAARCTWERALSPIRHREPRPGDALIYANLLQLADGGDGGLAAASRLVEEAADRHPRDPLVLWWRARLHVASERPAAAADLLERLLAAGSNGPPAGEIGYDRRLFGELPLGLLGVCRLQQGRPAEAAVLLRRAEALNPENGEIRAKRQLAEARERAVTLEGAGG